MYLKNRWNSENIGKEPINLKRQSMIYLFFFKFKTVKSSRIIEIILFLARWLFSTLLHKGISIGFLIEHPLSSAVLNILNRFCSSFGINLFNVYIGSRLKLLCRLPYKNWVLFGFFQGFLNFVLSQLQDINRKSFCGHSKYIFIEFLLVYSFFE
jgi:hypothetical protein